MPRSELISHRHSGNPGLSSQIYDETDRFFNKRDSNQVLLSIVKFYLNEGEDIFLSYTHGREHGPIIERTGTSSPFMAHLHPKYPGQTTSNPEGLRLRTWLILDSLRGDDVSRVTSKLQKKTAGGAFSETIEVLKAYQDENATIPAHDTMFNQAYPDYEIIGQQGCGDLTMNLWNVAYLNSPLARKNLAGKDKPLLIHAYDEPIAHRTYSCLIKQKPHRQAYKFIRDQLAIEDAKFDPNADNPNEMIYVNRNGNWQACGDEVEFALSNEQVLRDGKPVKLNHITEEFSDLRHLLYLPNLNPPDPLPGVSGDLGRPRFYFGNSTEDDIWFGEAQLLKDINLQRAAMEGPIFLSRLYQGLGSSVEQIRGAMALAEYDEVLDSRQELTVGQYRFVPEDNRQVEVYLKRNLYSWTMIGLNAEKDAILSLACQGDPRPGKRKGYVLEEAVEKLREAGAENALLIDEGADVFQIAPPSNGKQVKVAGGSTDLHAILPLLRTRLRATLIFAKRR